jgi:hypothetical protein
MQSVVRTNANDWSGRMQMGGQVSAITHSAKSVMSDPLHTPWQQEAGMDYVFDYTAFSE